MFWCIINIQSIQTLRTEHRWNVCPRSAGYQGQFCKFGPGGPEHHSKCDPGGCGHERDDLSFHPFWCECQAGGFFVQRYRARHSSRYPGGYFQTLFYHQSGGQGNRTRVIHLPWDYRKTWRYVETSKEQWNRRRIWSSVAGRRLIYIKIQETGINRYPGYFTCVRRPFARHLRELP